MFGLTRRPFIVVCGFLEGTLDKDGGKSSDDVPFLLKKTHLTGV